MYLHARDWKQTVSLYANQSTIWFFFKRHLFSFILFSLALVHVLRFSFYSCQFGFGFGCSLMVLFLDAKRLLLLLLYFVCLFLSSTFQALCLFLSVLTNHSSYFIRCFKKHCNTINGFHIICICIWIKLL